MVTVPHTHNIQSLNSDCHTVHIAGQVSVTLHESRVFVRQTTVRVGDKMQYKTFAAPEAARHTATKSTFGCVTLLRKVIEVKAYCATAQGCSRPTALSQLHISCCTRRKGKPKRNGPTPHNMKGSSLIVVKYLVALFAQWRLFRHPKGITQAGDETGVEGVGTDRKCHREQPCTGTMQNTVVSRKACEISAAVSKQHLRKKEEISKLGWHALNRAAHQKIRLHTVMSRTALVRFTKHELACAHVQNAYTNIKEGELTSICAWANAHTSTHTHTHTHTQEKATDSSAISVAYGAFI
ncbi:hypothetical protein, conserved in T. vivax [Trypanosoma vivax Y486]|uniref:Uncharacterized protein n=1 Tax=Trypanosoma vivax (strain Y486) TaxID=1055687 RepID=F9WVF9_TRYVY|nr:hypothetical protein, conserved in T. vivax [Trypanosoma vivax Y486]|eukprot:CCD21567.1 hypothetical protein, conserved in T. vivax [Trypanosoma vivax Y486]